MRIGLVSPYDLGRFGGVQDQLRVLAAELRRRGDDVVIVGPGETGPPGAALVGGITEVPGNGATTPITLSPRAVGRAVTALIEVDVIHLHEPLMPALCFGLLRRKLAPTVATFHADPPPWLRRMYRTGRSMVGRLLSGAQVVTAVSPVAASVIAGVRRPLIIPNALDLRHPPSGLARNEARIAFLGRNDPRKGLAVLLRAWPEVKAARPDAELIVIGTEPVRHSPGDVVFHGRVSEERKRDLLGASGVFCAPNTRGESFGVTVAEAMAAGCAVVASALPGFEFVLAGSGVTVPPGDSAQLAAALIQLLNDDQQRRRLRDAARSRAAAFDVTRVVDQYHRTYRVAFEA